MTHQNWQIGNKTETFVFIQSNFKSKASTCIKIVALGQSNKTELLAEVKDKDVWRQSPKWSHNASRELKTGLV